VEQAFSLIPTENGFWYFDGLNSFQKVLNFGDCLELIGRYRLKDVPDCFPVIHLAYPGEGAVSYFLNFSRKRWFAWDDIKFNSAGPCSLEVVSLPSKESYREAFNKGQEHLLKGDCYQYNLTFNFKFLCHNRPATPLAFARQLWSGKKHGSFAHLTFVPSEDFFFVSNSPECLFKSRQESEHRAKLWSMPIKGTMMSVGAEDREAWEKLSNSSKDDSELNMITDLIRNDLSKINEPCAQVIEKKSPLYVPGLVHQYSVIAVDLPAKTSLSSVVMALFPGGSITGAPKKRVMEILSLLEPGSRSLYTGSTILHNSRSWVSSINIRSMQMKWSTGECVYGAGGGITYKSDCESEYEEMINKVESFRKALHD
jgi:anthranilate/para-aminobenzoate synthase component I